MDPKLKAAIAARNSRQAKAIDPLRISIRAMITTENGETYYTNTCQGMIAARHREEFRSGGKVPFSTQANGTKRWIEMV